MNVMFTPDSILVRSIARRVALIYAGFSVAWILFSDQILLSFVSDSVLLTRIQMLKGWAFVVVTAYIVYFLLFREITKVKQAEKNSGSERGALSFTI